MVDGVRTTVGGRVMALMVTSMLLLMSTIVVMVLLMLVVSTLVVTTEGASNLGTIPMQSLALLQTRLVRQRRSPPEHILRLLLLNNLRHLELCPTTTATD